MELKAKFNEGIDGLRSPSTVLLTMNTENYGTMLSDVMNTFLLRRKGDAIYVTFNRPADSLIDIFKSTEHRERLLFLDAVSSRAKEAEGEFENVFFIPFPGDLTGLMIVLSRTLKMHAFKFIFLDSIPSVLVYNDERTTTRFLYALSALCKDHSVNLVLLSSNELSDSFNTSLSAITTSTLAAGSA